MKVSEARGRRIFWGSLRSSWSVLPGVLKASWMWIALYALAIIISDYLYFRDPLSDGGGDLGRTLLFLALLAAVAVKTHHLILRPAKLPTESSINIHFRYVLLWIVVGFASVLLMLVPVGMFFVLPGYYGIIGFPNFEYGYWGFGYVVIAGLCVFAMYLIYRLGLGLPNLAIAGEQLGLRQSWQMSRLLHAPLMWVCVYATLALFAITGAAELFPDWLYFGEDGYHPLHLCLSVYGIVSEFICILVGASIFSLIYQECVVPT